VAAIGSLPTDRPHARTLWDTSPRFIPGIVASGLVGLGRTTRDPRCRPDAHSPGVRASDQRPGKLSCVSACSPATARAIPKQSAATGTTDEPRGTGPTSLSAGDATLVRHEADRRGRAPLLRFVPLQHSPAAARRVRWMPTIRTIPLRRFRRRPARFVAQYRLSRRRPPVRFCARGSASWRRLMWRTCGSCSFVGRAPHEWDRLTFPKISTFDTSLITVAGVDPLVNALAVTRSTSVGAGSRLPVRGRVIRRGRFSHAVFRTRYSHPRAPQPGRAVWVLPSYRPAALLGLHPSQVCSRSAGGRAG
jgi:hypothetical protein